MLSRNSTLPISASWLTLAAIVAVSFLPVPSMWGINHLYFLPGAAVVTLLSIALVALAAPLSPRLSSGAETLADRVAMFIWAPGRRGKVIIALGALVIFYLARIDTYLLGDGYAWLGNMSRPHSYLQKWTEPLSMLQVRAVQFTLGGYSKETALLAFQLVSYISGAITVYNLLSIIERLCETSLSRLLALVTLLCSGALLLFLGYVEFYSALWATSTWFFASSIRYLQRGSQFWIVVVSFLACLSMHLQAFYFAIGLFYLFYHRYFRDIPSLRSRRLRIAFVSSVLVVSAVVFSYLYQNFLRFEIIFLPFFVGRSASPEYAVFSPKHLLDILNQILVIYPGSLVLAALALGGERRSETKSLRAFFGLCGVGSLAFLFMIDPVLGMTRDWDLLSLTALPLALFALSFKLQDQIVKRTLIPYVVLCCLMTGSYLYVNINTATAEERFHSSLRYYGGKERGGWIIYASYFKESGRFDRAKEIIGELNSTFPEDNKLLRFYRLLESGRGQAARAQAVELYKLDPYRSDFMQALGSAHRRLKSLDSSAYYYEMAIKMRPHHSMLLNEYGQLLMETGEHRQALTILQRAHGYNLRNSAILEGVALAYIHLDLADSALLISDSLFTLDSNSPGGNLVRVVVALNQGDQRTARRHYLLYKKYGVGRSDYERVVKYYRNLE